MMWQMPQHYTEHSITITFARFYRYTEKESKTSS
jgi:hypothetical protein